jgi:hypothetical protein
MRCAHRRESALQAHITCRREVRSSRKTFDEAVLKTPSCRVGGRRDYEDMSSAY